MKLFLVAIVLLAASTKAMNTPQRQQDQSPSKERLVALQERYTQACQTGYGAPSTNGINGATAWTGDQLSKWKLNKIGGTCKLGFECCISAVSKGCRRLTRAELTATNAAQAALDNFVLANHDYFDQRDLNEEARLRTNLAKAEGDCLNKFSQRAGH